MENAITFSNLKEDYIKPDSHADSDYFTLIKKLVASRNQFPRQSDDFVFWQAAIDETYRLVEDEIINNNAVPVSPVKFGTSGWRGILGKDVFCKSVSQVTQAIIALYQELDTTKELAPELGVNSLAEAKKRGCVIGFDNRFGGLTMARHAVDILTANGFTVHYAGEATTGTLSSAVLELEAAFSINLTPSHNPLEYGGFKFNAADAGPAAQAVTNRITEKACEIIRHDALVRLQPDNSRINNINALELWIALVRKNQPQHGLDYDRIIDEFSRADDTVVAIDCVHGASRNHIGPLFKGLSSDRLMLFRADADPTFGGIAPEPSSANMAQSHQALAARNEPFKLGVIIDPDADRIRFTDGAHEIGMNKFGAMAYHYLHEIKNKKGMVAKTVGTSNFANAIARSLNEEVFEPPVGFKEFKPVINKAIVCFEESDGITVIGHTPEKDAYIGLLLALDLVMSQKKNLGTYLAEIEEQFGHYYPDRDGVVVSQMGAELSATLGRLEKYKAGSPVTVGSESKKIKRVLDIDGRKMIFEDDSWLMIRPSGTEPKVRFYVESRTEQGKSALVDAAKKMLTEIGLLVNS